MGPVLLNADEVAAKVSESIKTISKLTGFSEKTVTLAECGIILKTCAARTKVADPAIIGARVRWRLMRSFGLTGYRQPGMGTESLSVNVGFRGPRGRMWRKTANSKFQLVGQFSDDAQTFTPTRFRYKREHWLDIKEIVSVYPTDLKRSLPPALASAGLARQSWVQIADDLGITLEDIPGGGISAAGIAKARRAIASNGRTYTNGIGTATYEENKSFLAKLVNQYPRATDAKLDLVLAGVLAGRAQYFRQNVAREVFASHAATVRAYPWLKLLGAPE